MPTKDKDKLKAKSKAKSKVKSKPSQREILRDDIENAPRQGWQPKKKGKLPGKVSKPLTAKAKTAEAKAKAKQAKAKALKQAKAKALKAAKAKANSDAKAKVKAKIKAVKGKAKTTTRAMPPDKAKALIDKAGKDLRRTKRSLSDVKAVQVSESKEELGKACVDLENLDSVSSKRGTGASHTEEKENGSHNGTLGGLPQNNAENTENAKNTNPPNTPATPSNVATPPEPPSNPPNAGALDVIHGISVMELALSDAGITPQYLAEKLVAELTANQVKVHYDMAAGKFVTSSGYIDWGTRQRARMDAQKLLGLYPAEELAHSLTEKTISFLRMIDGESKELLPIDDPDGPLRDAKGSSYDPDTHDAEWENVD